jgi:hypothetical protein
MINSLNWTQRPLIQRLALCLTLLLVLLVQFRAQIFNDFSVLYGDRYDAAIMVTIFEHWWNVLRGYSSWSQLYYFYPYTNTLGHTDGYFLIGLIYSAIRAFGSDPFLTTELTNVVLRTIGFFGFLIAVRKMFAQPFWIALLMAALFTFANSLTVHGQRLQLASIAFAPILALLMWEAMRALYQDQQRRFIGYGSAAGVLLGAWSISCFYLTWFYIFFTIFVFGFLLLGAGRPGRRELRARIARHKSGVIVVALVTIASLIPLLSVYLPKSRETGMRSIEVALSNTVPWQGIVQLGNDNLLFGKIYSRFLAFVSPGYVPNGEYYNTGVAPLLFLLFVFGCVYLYRSRGHVTGGASAGPVGVVGDIGPMPPGSLALMRAIAMATVVTWVLILDIGGVKPWRVIFYLVPGARALSVVSAYQIFLIFPVLIVAGYYLARTRVSRSMLFAVALLLLVEEVNDGYLALVRADEIKRVEVPAPPPVCKVFFAAGWENQISITPMAAWINNSYAHNVSAMLIAELHQIPTINGIASFNPPDWKFQDPNAPDYLDRIREYAKRHDIDGMCRLDLETKRWDTSW